MHTMYNSAARQDLLKHGNDASTNEIRDDEQLVDLLCTLISENEQVKENVAVVDEEERSEGGSTDKEYERKIVKNRNKKRIVVEDTTADSKLGPNDIRRYLNNQSIKTEDMLDESSVGRDTSNKASHTVDTKHENWSVLKEKSLNSLRLEITYFLKYRGILLFFYLQRNHQYCIL